MVRLFWGAFLIYGTIGSARLVHNGGGKREFMLNTQLVNTRYKMALVGLTESWRDSDKQFVTRKEETKLNDKLADFGREDNLR